MKTPTALIAAATLILAPALAFAGDRHHEHNSIQFNGPVELSSVQSLLDTSRPSDEREVIVEGHLLRQISKDTFVFSDGKTEIQVELDDDIPLNAPLDPQTKIRLYGEFDHGRTPQIDVDHIQLL